MLAPDAVSPDLPAGSDPKTSVLDPRGECWEVAGLYCLDASTFPTASGVTRRRLASGCFLWHQLPQLRRVISALDCPQDSPGPTNAFAAHSINTSVMLL